MSVGFAAVVSDEGERGGEYACLLLFKSSCLPLNMIIEWEVMFFTVATSYKGGLGCSEIEYFCALILGEEAGAQLS